MNHRSLAFRLAVWYALLLSGTFALVGAGMFYGLGHYLRSSLADSLRRRSTQVEQILSQAPVGVSDAAIAEAVETRVAPEFNNRFVRVTRLPDQLVYRSGTPADRSFDPLDIAPVSAARLVRDEVRATLAHAGAPVMVSSTPLSARSGQYLIELGTSLGPMRAVQERLLALLAVLLPVLVVCAAGAGYLLVGWALRPVDRMARTAEQMSVQNLEARLPVLPTGDALQRLSLSLNRLLTRLCDSMRASRRFLADASHELRTPLTVIKGELQEMVANNAVEGTLRERVGSVLEEVARLEHLVAGLLVLSRLDAGDAKREWYEVDLAAISASTADQMRLLAEDRGIHLDTAELEPLLVRGDRARLKQVIVNLLDNAIRFTSRGGTVTVRSFHDADGDVLEVRDTGVGIPAADLPHVFERFYRVDEARTREEGGAGLGLSIAQAICAAHGAQLEADSELGRGSRFRLRFPRPPAASGRRSGSAAEPPSRGCEEGLIAARGAADPSTQTG